MCSSKGRCGLETVWLIVMGCIYSEVTYRMILALCYCTTLLYYSASTSLYIWYWPSILSRRNSQSFLYEASGLGKNITFDSWFFNRIPNWTRILMMTVNRTTEQQQVTSARQALLIHQEWQLMAWWLLKCSKRHGSERCGGQLTNYELP